MKKLLEALKAKLGDDVITKEVLEDLQSQFDIVVNEKVQEELLTKVKELEEKSDAEMAEFKDSLIESLDKYIEYATDEYLKENSVAMEANAKIDAAGKILESAKAIMKENGLDLPEADLDRITVAEDKVKEITKKLDEAIELNIESKEQIFEYEKAVKFQKATSDLTISKIERVHTMLEGLDFANAEDFERKLEIIITNISKTKVNEDNNDNDDLDDIPEEDDKNKSEVDQYL